MSAIRTRQRRNAVDYSAWDVGLQLDSKIQGYNGQKRRHSLPRPTGLPLGQQEKMQSRAPSTSKSQEVHRDSYIDDKGNGNAERADGKIG